MIVKLYSDNPNEKRIRDIVQVLQRGGVIVYPTDTVYALGCALNQTKAIERIRTMKGKKETEMAIVFADLSHLADFARVDNSEFKVLKRNLPGPFTFILNASSKMSDKVLRNRKTVGIRIPDNEIALAIVRELGVPLVTTSVRTPDVGEETEYITDPELIAERFPEAELVIDGGDGGVVASAIVDYTGEEPEIVREGVLALDL